MNETSSKKSRRRPPSGRFKRAKKDQEEGQKRRRQQQRRPPKDNDQSTSNNSNQPKARRRGRKTEMSHSTGGRPCSLEHPSLGESDVMIGIEEQLRKQREQQQQKSKDEAKSQTKRPNVLGKYRYDSQRQAYFPITKNSSFQKTETEEDKNQSASPGSNHQPEIKSMPLIGLLVEDCPSKHRRALLRGAWAGRCIFNSMQLPSMTGPRLSAHQLDQMQRDVACKSLLHPSCRTFAVRYDSTTGNYCKPLIASIFDWDKIDYRHGVGIAEELYQIGGIHRDDHFVSLRQLSLGGRTYTGAICCGGSTNSLEVNNSFLLTPEANEDGNGTRYKSFECCATPHDFVGLDDKVLMAPISSGKTGPSDFVTFHLESGSLEGGRKSRTSRLPTSTVFCMEAESSNNDLRKKYVALGHRNGQVSIWDVNGNGICNSTRKSAHSGQKPDTFGNTVALQWLGGGNQVLAKGSLGDCRLYDTRQMGQRQNYQSYGDKETDPSLLWSLSAPPCCNLVRSKISLYCNGLAVDPTQSFAIAPLLNEKEDPCFGFWSVTTGQLVGLKQLQSNAASAVFEKPPPFLELATTTTPVFTTDEKGEFVLAPSAGNYSGVWFKSGRPLSPCTGDYSLNLSLGSGSIYHMTLAGGLLNDEGF